MRKCQVLNKYLYGLLCTKYTVSEYIIGAPKCKIIMVLTILSFFQYYNSNIKLLSIAPCKAINLNILFLYKFFGLLSYLFSM